MHFWCNETSCFSSWWELPKCGVDLLTLSLKSKLIGSVWSCGLCCAGVMANLKICSWQCQAADAKLLGADPRILQGRRCLCWAEGLWVCGGGAQECVLKIPAAAPEAHPLQCLAAGRVPTCTTLLMQSQTWNSAGFKAFRNRNIFNKHKHHWIKYVSEKTREFLTCCRVCPFQRSRWYRLCEKVEWKSSNMLFSVLTQKRVIFEE